MVIDNFQDRWDAIYDKYVSEEIKERAECYLTSKIKKLTRKIKNPETVET